MIKYDEGLKPLIPIFSRKKQYLIKAKSKLYLL